MNVEFNKPIEVNKKQYFFLTNKYPGRVAHRVDSSNPKDFKYFISVWAPDYLETISAYLNKN